jgi:TolB-like protein
MKKPFFMALFVLFGLVAFAQQRTVAVSPFEISGGFSQDEADVITELFTTELGSNKELRVVDRTSFDKIITEMKFQGSDWSNSQKVVQLGAALNASCIIRGQLMKMGSQMIITTRIIDVRTTQILASSRLQISNIDEIFSKMGPLVKELINQLPPPNRLLGTWRFEESNTDKTPQRGTIEFKSNGTFRINNHRYRRVSYNDGTLTSVNDYEGWREGTYTFTRDEVHFTVTRRSYQHSWEDSRKNQNRPRTGSEVESGTTGGAIYKYTITSEQGANRTRLTFDASSGWLIKSSTTQRRTGSSDRTTYLMFQNFIKVN